MSRSRRKHPIFGNCAYTEKEYKRFERKALRRAAKIAVTKEREPPHDKEYGNPWGGPKDGKSRWYWASKKELSK